MAVDYSVRLTFEHRIVQDEGGFWIAIDTRQPFDRTIKKGWLSQTLFEWDTTAMEWPISINFFNGQAMVNNAKDCGYIPYLGSLETIDHFQWSGHERLQLKYKNGQPYQLERPVWQIVGVDQASLERHAFAYTHAERDDVFKLQMRLSQMFDTVKAILAPWDDLVRHHYNSGFIRLEDVPENERDASREMLEAVKKEWAENTPIWAK